MSRTHTSLLGELYEISIIIPEKPQVKPEPKKKPIPNPFIVPKPIIKPDTTPIPKA